MLKYKIRPLGQGCQSLLMQTNNPILIPAGNPSDWTGPTGNNTYLLKGRIPTLIDAGVGKAEHVEAVARALDGVPLELVLITHGHPDHLSGAPTLVARWPRLRVRQYGTGLDPIRADEVIEAGDATVTAIYTPGHAIDHVAFLHQGDIFGGDLMRLGGTIVIPAKRGGDLTQYLDSLHKVRALRPARVLPGHGPIIDDPDAVIDEYLRHRAERDRQILEALAAGCRTPDEIVARLYTNLSPQLVRAAEESVLAHLIKLQKEGLTPPLPRQPGQ
jgi:glyoxylase-like metal-dependent hydrolase (beta-lactamase superfamily II)